MRRAEHEMRMRVLGAELENQEKIGKAYDAMHGYWFERRQREFGGGGGGVAYTGGDYSRDTRFYGGESTFTTLP